ncbi:MAG TPA: hypothetical protein VH085_00440, partial [Nocardioides sp.]|nr:hypothetical protein [Nocardioides sp.]
MRSFIIAGALALGLAALPVTAAEAGSTWRVTAKAGTHQVVVGKKVLISGHVRPGSAAAGTKLAVQEKFRPGVKWKTTPTTTKVTKSGAYRVKVKPTKAFTHQYRIVMPATAHHAKGVSPTVKIAVYAWSPLSSHPQNNNNDMGAVSVDINGKRYDNSVRQFGSSGSVEYNVDHVCTQVRATFGLSD